METTDAPLQTEPPSRLLKIEEDGDRWRGIRPKIRLMGRWLERAGFLPGHRVCVTSVAPGIIELRFSNISLNEVKPTPAVKKELPC